MKYYLIAGEASGDLHGASLLRRLKQLDQSAQFKFFGGDKMCSEAGIPVKHIKDMAFMGFIEVAMNLSSIYKNLNLAKKSILEFNPDALILIDFPGFNLKIAQFAKSKGIKVFYYISPKVWAWNQKRVLKIKRVVDHLFCILPFEKEFYKEWGMDIDYVGNPIMDALSSHQTDPLFKVNNGLTIKPIIALLPGSRKQEISAILPIISKLTDRFPSYQFVIAATIGLDEEYYHQFLNGNNIPIIYNSTYDLLLNSDAAIVTSGTATLETALLKTPQVVVYKGNPLSIAIARMVIKVKFISLVNLIMGEEVVKELIQQECTVNNISQELENILYNPLYHTKIQVNYDELAMKVGGPGASTRTAELVVKYLNNSEPTV